MNDLSLISSCASKPGKNQRLQDSDDSEEDFTVKRVNRKKPKIVEEDPYIADDEDEDYSGKKRRSIDHDNRLVMKVVKQGDYQHKQSSDRRSGGLGDIEQDFFLPRNLKPFNTRQLNVSSQMMMKSAAKPPRKFDSDEDSAEGDFELDDDDYDVDNKTKKADRAKTKAVFEMPRKPPTNYSKWSRWSKCSPKCVTRRFKKCRPQAHPICGNDIIREIAYCYTEGSFCEEWISSQISKIGSLNSIETPKPTTTKAPKVARRTESPLSNSVSQNFYGSTNNPGSKRKNRINPDSKQQNFQCGFPSIRNKNTEFALKIIGGKTSRRAQV